VASFLLGHEANCGVWQVDRSRQFDPKEADMTSKRQKTANQANSRHSTGPKTAEGKRAVRLNGLQHGLLSREVVLPGEDENAFETLRSAIHADLGPSGSVEAFLADRVVNTLWRLRRLERAETALFHWRICGPMTERLAAEVRSHEEVTTVGGLCAAVE
jgi:hypothetical protein